jgi:L-ascorbate metabolism protein UlaG (beta-lactamase superfamily)
MVDPFLTQNPKTPAQYKNLDALGKVDLILVTHAHGDHLGDGPDLASYHARRTYLPRRAWDAVVSVLIEPYAG